MEKETLLKNKLIAKESIIKKPAFLTGQFLFIAIFLLATVYIVLIYGLLRTIDKKIVLLKQIKETSGIGPQVSPVVLKNGNSETAVEVDPQLEHVQIKQKEFQHDYDVTVERSSFVVKKKSSSEVVEIYEYTIEVEGNEKLIVDDNHTFFIDERYLLFFVGQLLSDCESQENSDCLNTLADIIVETGQYGGIWKLDIETREWMHVTPILRSSEGSLLVLKDMGFLDTTGHIYLAYQEQDDPDGSVLVTEYIDPISGQTSQFWTV